MEAAATLQRMDQSLFLAFVAATILLALFPGPNMALIISNSVAHGARYGFWTLLGTSAALAVQLAVVALGMTTLLATAGTWFDLLRWGGALYLIWMGIQAWRAPVTTLATAAAPPRPRATVTRGFLVSITNPKTLLFFGAFFPQFVSPGHAMVPQLLAMSVTFLVIVAALDSVWAALAGRLRGMIVRQGRLPNRICGGLLVSAGLALAAARTR